MTATALAEALRTLARQQPLDRALVVAAFGEIMQGSAPPAQVAALLMGLRVKGETAEEVAGVVEALRSAMVPVAAAAAEALVDTCGTGGGALTTFNISTAAALLAAGCGVRIAKHGNRSFTSRSGSADVLEALGIPIDLPPAALSQVLEEAGIVFMFAPLLHPALRHVGPVRRELAVPTVMNLVGPLANPARAGRQVVGVADADRQRLVADALHALGTVRALVVHGHPGLDEVSPLGPTQVLDVRPSGVTAWDIDPAVTGGATVSAPELSGGSPAENAAVIEAVLSGHGPAGARAAVVLNAAAALLVADAARDYAEAVALARSALEAGAGMDALERLRTATHRAASP